MFPAGSLNQAMYARAGPVDALGVLAHAVVLLQVNAAADQLVHGRVDVVHPEVEDRVGGGLVAGLRVDQGVPAAGQVQRHQPVLLGRADAQCLAVELPRRLKIVDGEPAERLGVR